MSIAFWFLGASLFQIILGPLSDHFSRRKILLSGGILFVFVTFLCSFTQSFCWFLVGVFFQGYVASTVVITGYAEIHEIMEREQAVKTLLWMGSITILGPLTSNRANSLL